MLKHIKTWSMVCNVYLIVQVTKWVIFQLFSSTSIIDESSSVNEPVENAFLWCGLKFHIRALWDFYNVICRNLFLRRLILKPLSKQSNVSFKQFPPILYLAFGCFSCISAYLLFEQVFRNSIHGSILYHSTLVTSICQL